MTKEEKIKEAYGEYWEKAKDHVDENGWLDAKSFYGEAIHKGLIGLTMDILDPYDPKYCYWKRPVCLGGIENNNGWTVLTEESYETLENGDYMWYNNQNGDWEIDDLSESHLQNYTHFQAITYPPKPPIY